MAAMPCHSLDAHGMYLQAHPPGAAPASDSAKAPPQAG